MVDISAILKDLKDAETRLPSIPTEFNSLTFAKMKWIVADDMDYQKPDQ